MFLEPTPIENLLLEIWPSFLEETKQYLTTLKQGTLHLQSNSILNEVQTDYSALNRAAHSIRGAAGMLQLYVLERLACGLEELFKNAQSGKIESIVCSELLFDSVQQIDLFISTSINKTWSEATSENLDKEIFSSVLNNLEKKLSKLSLLDRELEVSETVYPITPSSSFTQHFNLHLPIEQVEEMSKTTEDILSKLDFISEERRRLSQVYSTLKQRSEQLTSIGMQLQKQQLRKREKDDSSIGNILQILQELEIQFREVVADVGNISYKLQEASVPLIQKSHRLRKSLIDSRMVSFGSLASELESAKNQLVQKCDKTVKLAIEGKEIYIDRAILEQLRPLLIQLLRNAFDHGIEFQQQREEQGKPLIAQVTVTASIQRDRFVISVKDDGRGVDTALVLQKALEKGLYDRGQELNQAQILNFIFYPGFSTVSTPTAISGRGVGLDIVKQQVQRLDGTIQIETKPGRGTKFTISIPLTLNFVRLLLCQCLQQKFAVPLSDVKAIIHLTEYPEKLLHGSTMMCRDRPAQLYYLSYLLPYTHPIDFFPLDPLNSCLGIEVELNSKAIVLAVDAIMEEKQLLVKPLPPLVKVPAYILGCAATASGEIALVISPDCLEEVITQNSDRTDCKYEIPVPQQGAKVLVVDDSSAYRQYIVPLLLSNNYDVMECENGVEALKLLSQNRSQFGLVISDIEMPEMNGFTLLKEIRFLLPSIPIVVLSSRASKDYYQTAKDLGATEYLTKPILPNDFLTAIASIIPIKTSQESLGRADD